MSVSDDGYMPSAGKYDYPFFDIDSCIEKLAVYYNVVKTDITSRDEVAQILKMSKTGGGFVNLISSMKDYDLVETGKNNITITELGKLILHGEPAEKESAKKKAVSNVDLFREICELYGKDATEEQIRSFMRQKANVDISEVQKIAKNVGTIYKKVSIYIIPAKRSGSLPSTEGGFKGDFGRREIVTENINGKEPLRIQGAGLYVEISSDADVLEHIEDAKELLAFWEQRLRKKQQGSNEPIQENVPKS